MAEKSSKKTKKVRYIRSVGIPKDIYGEVKKQALKEKRPITYVIKDALERFLTKEPSEIMKERDKQSTEREQFLTKEPSETKQKPSLSTIDNSENDDINKKQEETGGKALSPKEEKKMEKEDKEFISNLVEQIRKDVDSKIEPLAKTVESLKTNTPPKSNAVESASPPKETDIASIVNKVLETREREELKRRERERQEEEKRRFQKEWDEYKKKLDLICNATPDNPLCKISVEEAVKKIQEEQKKEPEKTKQKKELEKKEGTKEEKKARQEAREALKRLPEINREIRARMTPEQIEERTKEAAQLMDKLGITPVDAWNILWSDERDRKGIIANVAKDEKAVEEVLKATEAKKIINACNLGDEKACKEVEEVLEKKGYALAKIDKKGKKRWKFINPDLEGSHF